MSDLAVKFENLQNAVARLEEGAAKLNSNDDLYRDGVIQRFEFTFEFIWKTLKAYLEEEGLQTLGSPKSVLREAYAVGIIDDEGLWLDILRDRNLTSHTYQQELAIRICNSIKDRYIDAFRTVTSELKAKIE
jgi:nucleotidyltransferase substrate binding protein (TIGR01987 family)